MNWTDCIILGVLALSVLIGLFRGLIAEVLSLVIWVAAFWATALFGPIVTAQLAHSISSVPLRTFVGYGVCFVVVLILGAIIRFTVRRLIWSAGLSGVDRLFGTLFGFVRGVLIVAVLVFLVDLTGFTKESWWRESTLAPQFQGLASWLGQAVPTSIPASLRDRVHPEAVLDKIHPSEMLDHMPDLSKLPHVPTFGSPLSPSSARTALPAPATSVAPSSTNY
ncbi:membrane protein required for colicin V production [Rhodanobacter sp. ANJX3]|jgi:membrane protein required for colicin V production|uniref:CvpA family protein n=1 Tax=Rhodanobacter sp. ANJX3 TaxID=2723083 RepID=UPI0016216406|nr:CvpA family protein [Rhodanobacter sp. ANJX3]MBB5357886.1 membrane protein required for colicin V production [Rhodanobacter sp. ANJX3]